MRMFVGIKMADRDPGVLQAAKLCGRFGFDIPFRKPSRPNSLDKPAECWSESCSALRKRQRGNLRRGQQRITIHEDDVAAHAKARRSQRDRLLKLGSCRHERG